MEQTSTTQAHSGGGAKFIIGGLFILAAVIFLIFTATSASAQFFLTVDELLAKGETIADQEVRVAGAVIGDTIQYDSKTLTLKFTVAHIPGDNDEVAALGGLGAVLKAAVADPQRARIQVVYIGPKPDLLRNEAQAIMTGKLAADGVFYINENDPNGLLLKCPTKYEEAVPEQASGQ